MLTMATMLNRALETGAGRSTRAAGLVAALLGADRAFSDVQNVKARDYSKKSPDHLPSNKRKSRIMRVVDQVAVNTPLHNFRLFGLAIFKSH